MDSHAGLLLFAAGLVGGIITAMVGGASLICFPALLAAGLPPIIANASSTVALTPGNLVAGLADLERMPRWDRAFAALALIAIAGSVAGAALLLATPEKAFTAVVPLSSGSRRSCSPCPGESGSGWPGERRTARARPPGAA